MLDINQIKQIIPHRYPFLLVDKIIELEPGKRVVGLKNVTANEEYFNGHFPGYPVMPGVLIIEALAQTGAVGVLTLDEYKGKLVLFAGINNVKFRRQVVPGDQLRLEIEVTKLRGRVGKCEAKAYVDEDLAVEGELMFAIAENDNK
ncbi:MAG: 3-hydroxyacyl-[acyl-carrier-protein] dehydratase [Clostridia bacterium]|jgi:3-hydroxyacyl-[acyl-carrier-protein] dehydratase|nr:3-hydroxyacyl-[acyl-carrier-protein] dehydratase [Clostridia bacterium]